MSWTTTCNRGYAHTIGSVGGELCEGDGRAVCVECVSVWSLCVCVCGVGGVCEVCVWSVPVGGNCLFTSIAVCHYITHQRATRHHNWLPGYSE